MALKTHCFALVVCQRKSDGRFIAVDESENRGWWLPGGRLEDGESFEQAAIRETLEEAGAHVHLEGVLRVEHTPMPGGNRMRVIYYARPVDESAPLKSKPDGESNGARWVSGAEVRGLGKIRGDELPEWIEYVEHGGVIHPMSVMTAEAAPVNKRRSMSSGPFPCQ
eukprot:Opistho-1_new@1177